VKRSVKNEVFKEIKCNFMKRKEKIKDFSSKTKLELQKLLAGYQDKLRQLKFDLISGKIKNVKEIRELRKDIARIKTLLKNIKS